VVPEDRWQPGYWKADGHPVALDPDAASADQSKPAFLAPPPGAPVYYGFRLIPDVERDGFRLGMVTDFLAETGAIAGDLFIVAPDGSRAGIEWSIGSQPRFGEVLAPSAERWGVYRFEFTEPLRTVEDARWHFDRIVPVLRPKWEAWRTPGPEQRQVRRNW
jgi:hypothetical protein